MRISCIGGGPASLYFALLMKKAYPDADITVHERNKADDTFGWGVVFSDETLGHFETADPESYAEIRRLFRYWGDIDTYVGGALVRSTGHGFCGMSRKRLLQVFHDRCRSLGVTLRFQDDVPSVEAAGPADLVVAADGVHSAIRTARAAAFRPTIEWGACRFTWLGTTKPLTAFTFVFRENEHGLFVVHAYPFEAGLSTWIVECTEATWLAAGLDRASEDDTVAYVRRLFADHLDGHQVLTNKSIWRRFPMISCESLARRERRPDGGRGPHGALLDRLGHQARHGGRHRAGRGVPRAGDRRRPPGARRLRGRAPGRRAEGAAGGARPARRGSSTRRAGRRRTRSSSRST